MSKNLTRKGLALVSGAALAVTSLVGFAAPANAAGEVTLAPTTGTGNSAFSTDPFSLTTDVISVGGPAITNLAYYISNPDQHQLKIDVSGATDNATGSVTGVTATGATVSLGSFTAGEYVIVDFDDATPGYVAAYVEITGNEADAKEISITLDDSAFVTFAKTNESAVAYGDFAKDAEISVQSWIESESPVDYSTVDARFASEKVDVTFVDPKNVSIISEVVRSVSSGTTDLGSVNFHETAQTGLTFSAGDGVFGGSLSANDRVLLTGQTDPREDGIYVVQGATVAPVKISAGLVIGPLSGERVLVTEGNNAGKTRSLTKLTGAAVDIVASDVTGTGFTNLNQVGDLAVTGTLRFSRSDINLNQVVLTNFNYGVETSATVGDVALEAIVLRTAAQDFSAANNFEVLTAVGQTAGNHNRSGSLLVRAEVATNVLEASKTYQLRFQHIGTAAPVSQSPAFTTVANGVAPTAVKVTSKVTSTTDAKTDATLRAGTKSFTYRGQAELTDGVTDVKTANIPMVAVVQAGSFMPTGESITVSGSTKPITRANEAVVVAGLSDADGRFSVTVNSTTAAALQSYKVSFYIADGGNLGKFVVDAAPLTGTYASAVATTATPTPTIAASSEVTVKVAITDQFGQPVSTRGASALNVELKAPDKTKLEQFTAVVAGEASFTFTNYLATGESDVLTARVYVGTSTSPTYTGLQTQVNMYAPVAVTGINVAPEVTGVVVNYVDFITGKTTTAKPGPTSGTTYSGTVVNANGAGIPGAAITIAGTGFQFKSGTSFTVDSVTLTTDSAGGFSVEMWTTVASAAGNKLTVTAGDKTVSTLIKSVLPSTTSTKNLVFSWDVPAVILSNTTYAITAKVTDKFGNGVPSASVTFSGFGAAQFNGLATATRTTDRSGNVTAFLRSLKDVDGVSAIGVELLGTTGFTFTSNEGLAAVYTDVTTTSFDESKWTSVIENTIDFLKTAPAAASKVNAGSFKGYVALYALGYEGQRMSAKVGNDWVIVPAIPAATNDLFRAVEFVGAGVEISVRLYIDRVLVATIPLLTK
jgi:hypothetical protein